MPGTCARTCRRSQIVAPTKKITLGRSTVFWWEQDVSLRFDRRFPALGVPRIQHSSDTSNPQEFQRRNDILTRLARTGIAETLRAFAGGEIDIDDLLRFDDDETLKRGLDDLRRERTAHIEQPTVSLAIPAPSPVMLETTASSLADTDVDRPVLAPASASVPSPTPAPAPSPNVALSSGWDAASLWPGISINSDFLVPLWDTCLTTVIPGMLELEETTRRRYSTSIRALRQKLAVCRATEDQFDVLAGISPDNWETLGKARMRLSTQTLREAVALPLAQQRVLLVRENVRLHVDVLQLLQALSATECDVLVELADFPVTAVIMDALDHASAVERAALRSVAQKLGPDATLLSLGTVTRVSGVCLRSIGGPRVPTGITCAAGSAPARRRTSVRIGSRIARSSSTGFQTSSRTSGRPTSRSANSARSWRSCRRASACSRGSSCCRGAGSANTCASNHGISSRTPTPSIYRGRRPAGRGGRCTSMPPRGGS